MSHSQQPAPSGQPPHPFAPPQAAGPPKKNHAALKIAVGVVCAGIVFGLGAAVGSGNDGGKKTEAKPGPTVTVTVTAKTAKVRAEKPKSGAKPVERAEAAAPDATVGQGSYLVGEDIAMRHLQDRRPRRVRRPAVLLGARQGLQRGNGQHHRQRHPPGSGPRHR